MAAQHLAELRVALRREYREGMADGPDQEPGNPAPEAEAERRRQRAVNDGDGAWRPGEQDRLGERAVQRHLEAPHVVRHVNSPPPPNENGRASWMDRVWPDG